MLKTKYCVLFFLVSKSVINSFTLHLFTATFYSFSLFFFFFWDFNVANLLWSYVFPHFIVLSTHFGPLQHTSVESLKGSKYQTIWFNLSISLIFFILEVVLLLHQQKLQWSFYAFSSVSVLMTTLWHHIQYSCNIVTFHYKYEWYRATVKCISTFLLPASLILCTFSGLLYHA